jgi:hypothetical protein
MAFANEGLMIAEQGWDRRDSPGSVIGFGSGTGSATPLAWSSGNQYRERVKHRNTADCCGASFQKIAKGKMTDSNSSSAGGRAGSGFVFTADLGDPFRQRTGPAE